MSYGAAVALYKEEVENIANWTCYKCHQNTIYFIAYVGIFLITLNSLTDAYKSRAFFCKYLESRLK